MESKKVSIIVPVYKVEKYLEECLDSLKKQTYTNLEIILCDDESPDRCPQICEKYAAKDERFKVLHKKNGGAASARNAGLEIATGDYIGFVDSDDLVKEEYIESLVKSLENNDVDISVCAFYDMYVNRENAVKMEKEGIYSTEQYLERFLWDWKCGLLWNKLFKAELMQGVRFSEGHVIDDEFFTYKVVMNAKRIEVKNEKLYYYRFRKSGTMNQGRRKQMLIDRMEYFSERFEVVTEYFPELYEKYLENFTDNLIHFTRESECWQDVKEVVVSLRKKYNKRILTSNIKWKLKYAYLYSKFPKKCGMKEIEINVDEFFD